MFKKTDETLSMERGRFKFYAFYFIALIWFATCFIGSILAGLVFKADSSVYTNPEKPIAGICVFFLVLQIGCICAFVCRNSHFLLFIVNLAMLIALSFAFTVCNIIMKITYAIANPLCGIFAVLVFLIIGIVGLFKPLTRGFIFHTIGLVLMQYLGTPFIIFLTRHKILAIILTAVIAFIVYAILSPEPESDLPARRSGGSNNRKPNNINRTVNNNYSSPSTSYNSSSSSTTAGMYDRDIAELEKEIKKLEKENEQYSKNISDREKMIASAQKGNVGSMGSNTNSQISKINDIKDDIRRNNNSIAEKRRKIDKLKSLNK